MQIAMRRGYRALFPTYGMFMGPKGYIKVSKFKNFNVIDPDCLAKAAVDARWSYEGTNAMSWVFFFFPALFISYRFLLHDIIGLMGGDDSLHTLIQVLPGLLAVHLLEK